MLALFDRAGFGPNAQFDPAKLPGPLVDGLRSAARAAQKSIRELSVPSQAGPNGWSPASPSLGAYGDDYLLRATTARRHRREHPRRDRQRRDHRRQRRPAARRPQRLPDPLRGGRAAAERAFWSIAAYAADSRLLLDTRTGRYAVGSSTEGLHYEPSGALEIFVSSAAPEDPAHRANWLPVRAGPLLLVARIYQPLPAVLEGGYPLPPVVSADD